MIKLHSRLRIASLAAVVLAGFALAACQPDKSETAAASSESCGQSAAPPPAAPGVLQVQPLKWSCRKLANGLRVYSMPDANTASASVAVWYDVGSKNDPAGRSGFAHLFEHLMFKSTANMPAENFDRLTEDVGGFNNASTTDDYTDYYETVPANHLQRVLWAESERMGALVVDEGNFQSERKVVEEELRQSVLSNPYGKLFYLYLNQTAFDKHPYGRTTIGSIANLDAATVEDVRAFHAAYYRPDNAVLVVSGNFDQKQLDGWVNQYFAPIATPKRAIPQVTTVEPPRTAPRAFTVYEPNVPLPAVAISWPAPAATDKDHAALLVMDAILTAGQSSRLYESLVHDRQVASQANSFATDLQQPGFYALYAILSQGKSADDGLKALDGEIAKMRDTPVTQAEIDKVENLLVTSTLNQRETSDGRAAELAHSVIVFNDPTAGDKLLNDIQKVTPADVQRVARAIMDDNRSVTIRYLPEASMPKGAKSDVIADSPTIETVKIDIPTADIPVFTLAPEDKRVQPPPPGPPIPAKVPGAVEKTLPNGLRVIVATKPGLPLVSANLSIAGGSALDPATKAGLASLTADMATRGTATRSATDIARQVESLGGSLSSGAGPDASNVSLGVRSDKAKDLFAIFADVVENPAFKDDELARATHETLDQLAVALRRPTTVGSLAMRRALYGVGPYGLIASPKSVAGLKRNDATGFHDTWWRPDNAVLVIAGDVSTDEGFKLAENALGDWKKPEAPLQKPAATAAKPATKGKTPHILIDIPKVGQAAVLIGQTGPSRTDADYFPTLIANDVLGGGYSSRLNEEIRIKRGMSYGSSSGFGTRKMSAPIVAVTPTANPTVPDVVDLMSTEMSKLASSPMPVDEIDNRKAVLIGDFGRSVETTGGLAGQYSELAQFGLPLDRLQTYASEISGVTPEQATAAAKAHLDPANAAIVVVGDAAVFGDKLAKAHPDFGKIGIDKLNLDSATLK
jgi:zinc protease